MQETGTPATLKTLMHCFNSVYYSLDTVEVIGLEHVALGRCLHSAVVCQTVMLAKLFCSEILL